LAPQSSSAFLRRCKLPSARAVLRRAVGYPTALDNGRDLSRFLLLSPVYCLTSATLLLSGLWTIGVVPWSDLLTSWVSWWIGDTLGVLDHMSA
jgi:integral membrane sensor domain MASE1